MGRLIIELVIHMHLDTILSMECILINRLGDGSLESPLIVVMVSEIRYSRVGKNEIADSLSTKPCNHPYSHDRYDVCLLELEHPIESCSLWAYGLLGARCRDYGIKV
ncbi:unnamed protein product [Lactuca saligna]|uniref:Uncharacterized protein n=1 Tax=Lactuca saligna TaxID=75948 RepID=A0AA36EFK2_LACSI|nr:unnamed protein product [Lactuca saligna]